jgi:predicted MPP superfamily phosphohydrolase
VIDFLWQRALPLLNISYGSARWPLLGYTVFRGVILLVWFVFEIGLYIWKGGTIHPSFRWHLILANLVFLGLILYSSMIEPEQLTVTKIQIPVEGFDHPVRIVQLSDLHVERITAREQAIPKVVKDLQPQLIVFTGDFVNKSYGVDYQLKVNAARKLISQLSAPYGLYGVNGNVDTASQLREIFTGLEFTILDNQVIRIPQIGKNFVLIGASFRNWFDDGETLKRLSAQIQPGDFSVLLYHKPDLAYIAQNVPINLYLAGHTHGGQIRIPFYGAIFSNSKYGKTFEMGRYSLEPMTLFVSRGIGFSGGSAPRLRFLAPPEIVVIDLIPQ